MSAEELNTIWERRNLAYYHRRQRKLAEARQQQQQQQDLSGGDDNSVGSCSCSSYSSGSLGEGVASSSPSPSPPPQPQRDRGQQLTRPAGFVCAADDPKWQAFTSRNIMGDYDPERARTEHGYHRAWVSCERLVNMRRSCASDAGNFIPTNPRLAALLEHRRLEVARERYEEAQQQFSQVGAPQEDSNDNMILDSAPQEPSPFESFSTQDAAEQAAEYERLNQEHRLQKASHAQGNSSNLKTPSLESSAGEKSVQMPVKNNDYYMALSFPTSRFPKSVRCEKCNCELFTSPLAKRFFCQTCGCVARVPVSPNDVDANFDEKMQDAEDQDYQNMCYR